MNIYDWIIVVIWALAALWGLRKGAIGMTLTVVGIIVAMWLSANFAGTLVKTFVKSIQNEALATAIGYVVIFIAVFIAAGIVGRILRTVLTFTMLGWTDKVAGVALGLVAGLLLSLGLTMVVARYTYVVDTAKGSDPMAQVERYLSQQGRNRLDKELTQSELVPTLIHVRNAIPASMLGLVPGDFNKAIDILESRRS